MPSREVPCVLFHLYDPLQEEAKADGAVAVETLTSKGGLFGTGLSEWFTLPINTTNAIPLIHFDWYVINRETQLATVFFVF